MVSKGPDLEKEASGMQVAAKIPSVVEHTKGVEKIDMLDKLAHVANDSAVENVEEDEAPEEVALDAARSTAVDAFDIERAGRASVRRARKELMRTRARTLERRTQSKNDDVRLPENVLERAAAAQKQLEAKAASPKVKPTKIISKVQKRTAVRSLGRYRVVPVDESGKRAHKSNGIGALELMRSASDGDNRVSAISVAQRGLRAKGKKLRKR